MIEQLIDKLEYTNLQHRGYMVVQFTPESCQAQWSYLDSVKKPHYQIVDSYAKTLRTLPGKNNRKLLD